MTYSIGAAPGGSRIGVIAASGSEGQVLLTVAPKAWRDGPARQFMVDEWQSGHANITLYETDRLHIRTLTQDAEDMFASMLWRSRETASPRPQEGWQGTLLAPEVAPRTWDSSAKPDREFALNETGNLLRLFQRVGFTLADNQRLTSREARSPIFRPLTSRQFLDEVEIRTAQARRGYRGVRERRVTIRGRVETASIARYSATGLPVLTCVYDELTESTVLLGVICAALENVAEGTGPRSVLNSAGYNERSLRQDAIRLRRALGEIEAPSRHVALARGHDLRLSRLDRPRTIALQLALVLLSGRELVPRDRGSMDFNATELSAETDKIWEWIVNAALIRSRFDEVLEQGPKQHGLNEDPWKRHPLQVGPHDSRAKTYPDNIAYRTNDVFIVDAKYKTPPSSPSRDDQYQMFAYSHLVRSRGREVRAAVLVYPGEAATTEWTRGRDEAPGEVRLFAVQLQFPRPADLLTRRSWDSYLDRIASRLTHELGGLEAVSANASPAMPRA